MSRCSPCSFALAAAMLCLAGCQSEPVPQAAVSAPPRLSTKPGSAKQNQTVVGELVHSGEYYDAAVAIQKAALTGPDALAPLFDMQALCNSALEGLEVTDKFRDNFRKGVGSNSGYSLYHDMCSEVRGTGSYRLVHVHRRGPQHRALFRISIQGGLGYHDLHFTKNADGKIVVSDIYVVVAGEELSSTVRHLAKLAAASDRQNLLPGFLQTESKFVAEVGTFFALSDAMQSQDFARVLSLYDSLSPEVKQIKPAQVMRINAAVQLGNRETYRAAAREYQELFPGDPAIDLMMIDLLIHDRQLEEALATIDRLDQSIGGDPHLHVFRGIAYREAGRADEAEKHFLLAIADPAALMDAYRDLVDLSLQNQQHDKTLKYLQTMEQRYDVELGDDLASLPNFAEFVKSPQYQEWLKREKE